MLIINLKAKGRRISHSSVAEMNEQQRLAGYISSDVAQGGWREIEWAQTNLCAFWISRRKEKKNSVDENCFSTQKHGKSYVGWARWILLGYSRGEHGYLLEEMDRGWQLGPDNCAPLRTGSFATEHAHQGGWKRKGCIQAPQKLRA